MIKPKQPTPMIKGHPMALGSFPVWAQVLARHGVDRGHLSTALRVSLISLATAPLRIAARLKTNKRLEAFEPAEPPIFVIGFWRSGTTYLHNLFTQDARLGYVTQFQSMAPELFLTDRGLLKKDLSRRLAEERPQDGVRLAIDTPQEEEFPLACVTSRSFYHGFLYFPRGLRADFSRAILLDQCPDADLKRWLEQYRKILTRAALYMDQKRLVLKNPPNLGRVKTLMDAFPGAKFVHIHRNPYEVIPSLIHTLETLRAMFGLQNLDNATTLDDIFFLYREMFGRYIRDAALVPEGQLVDVSYYALDRDPVGEMRRIYQTLGIGFAEAEPAVRDFVDRHRTYRKNVYRENAELESAIARHCGFALERWGYARP